MCEFGFRCRSKRTVTPCLMLGLSSREFQSEQNNTEYSSFPIQIQHPSHWPLKMLSDDSGFNITASPGNVPRNFGHKNSSVFKHNQTDQCIVKQGLSLIFTQDVYCQFSHICHTTYICSLSV